MIEGPDFSAVVFCGTGESMNPLTVGDRAIPKALLPIGGGQEVLVDRVLAWIEASGIIDVLLLCPPEQIQAITEHLQTSWHPSSSSAPHHGHGHHASATTVLSNRQEKSRRTLGTTGSDAAAAAAAAARRHRHAAGADHHRLKISVHGLDERIEYETLAGGGSNGGVTGAATTAANGIGKRVAADELGADDVVVLGRSGAVRQGTGRVLRRWRDHLLKAGGDFVVLPCDLSPPPALSLSSLLDQHRNQMGSLVTSLWYEKGELELKDGDGPESVLVAWNKSEEEGDDKTKGELLGVTPLEELEDELELRMSLLDRYPTLNLTTRLMDAHVYVFRRQVLDLMMTKDPKDLDSIREDVVPWLVKGGWQEGLRRQWKETLKPAHDPLAAAFHLSVTSEATTVADDDEAMDLSASMSLYDASRNATTPSSPIRTGESLINLKSSLIAENDRGVGHSTDAPEEQLRCSMMIWKLPATSTSTPIATSGKNPKQQQQKEGSAGGIVKEKEPEQILIRANTVASYWELNRQYLREMPIEIKPRPDPNAVSPAAASNSPIDPRAQVSPDSQLDPTTKVAERSSIKRSLIGRHCVIGKNVRLTGCIVWDFVNIADGVKLENSIVCNHVRVGEKSQITSCELGSGVQIPKDTVLKNERIAAGDDF